MTIREMKIEDYDNVFALWKTIKGFGIRSVDDSREGIERFLKWNPGLSVVAEGRENRRCDSLRIGWTKRMPLPCMCT